MMARSQSAEPRTLPHSEESERAVLAGLLLDAAQLAAVAGVLEAADWYRPEHRLIWEAIVRLHEGGHPVDLRTVQAELEQRGKLDACGGLAYLSGLDLDLPDLGRLDTYAAIIRDRSVRRQAIARAHQVLDAAQGEAPTDELVAGAEEAYRTLGTRAAHTGGLRRIGPVAAAALERIEERDLTHLQGIPTGYADLDGIIHGLCPGRLIVVAGRPGMGKSALAVNVLAHVTLRERRPAALWSLEMSAEEVSYRILCSEANVPGYRLRSGHLSVKQWERLVVAARFLQSAPLQVDDRSEPSVRQIAAAARRLRDAGELELLVIDYLQLMNEPGGWGNRNLEIGAITRGLKRLARELEIPVILLSQLTRDPDRRGGDHRPRLADLRDSGAIEADADLVAFVHREELYKPDDPELQGRAELLVAKQRNGELGTVELAWHGETTTFKPLSPPPPATPEAHQEPIPWTPPAAGQEAEDPF